MFQDVRKNKCILVFISLIIAFSFRERFSIIRGDADKVYDYLPLFSIFVIAFLILEPLFKFLLCEQKSNQGGRSLCNRLFLLLFVLICIIPITKVDNKQIDDVENRKLADFPSLIKDGHFNEKYSRLIENWFNDHFRGRKYFIAVHDNLKKLLSVRYDGKRAFEGKDKWLFYKGDSSVELYQHRMNFSETQLEEIDRNFKRYKEYFDKKGIYFAVMIAPNKADVYGEYYPEYINQYDVPDRIQCLKKYLDVHKNPVLVTYPLSNLMEHKKDGLLYWKVDTHWNQYGAYIGYLSWINQIQKDMPDVKHVAYEEIELDKSSKEAGDLTPMLNIKDTAPWKDDWYYDVRMKSGEPYTLVDKNINEIGMENFHTVCHGKKHKVAVFRDSFTTSMLPYIASSFGEVYFIWSFDFNRYTDFILENNIDMVLVETVSRSAGVWLNPIHRWEEQ